MHYRILILFTALFIVNHIVLCQSNCNCTVSSKASGKTNQDSALAAQLISSNQSICKAKGFELIGQLMSDKNKFDSAEYFFYKSESIYKQNRCNDSLLMSLYGEWSKIYYKKGNFGKAQEYSLKLLHCAEIAGNYYQIALSNTMIGQLFNETSQPEKGIVYTRIAAKLLSKIQDLESKNDILYVLASRYLWYYQDTKIKTVLDSSKMFAFELLSLSKQQNNKKNIARAFSSLQSIEFERGNLRIALQLLDSALEYTNKTGYDDLRIIYFDKAEILLQLKDYNAAQICADSVVAFDKITSNKANFADAYTLIAKIAQEKGDYEKAYRFKELARNITDSILSIERTASVNELEKKYNQAKNEKTITDLANQKQLYLLLAITGLLFVVIIALFLRQQSLRNKKKILEAEQRLNRARMNPHFLFNSLMSLQKIALNENNGETLAINLSKFSNIMRATLESTYKEYITIEEEIEFLYEYLDVQKNRFANNFSFKVAANEKVEVNELLIPPMLIQPFVENSIEHGFSGISYEARIYIAFSILDNELLIEINDNGKGLQTAKHTDAHISRARQIITERLYLLNLKQKTRARFNIYDNHTDKGATVKIYLPILYKDDYKITTFE